MTKEEFDDWKESFGTKYFFNYLKRRQKEITENLCAPLIDGGTISPELQLVHKGRMWMVKEILNTEFEHTEREDGSLHREVSNNSNMGKGGSPNAGY